MARRQQAQPVTAITTTPADAHIGTPVFAAAGTDKQWQAKSRLAAAHFRGRHGAIAHNLIANNPGR
jgi:hypothetical protein